MQWSTPRDPHAWDGYMGNMARTTLPSPMQDITNLFGPAVHTMVELATNRDTFRDRYIEPPWQQNPSGSAYVPSVLRSNEYSSLVAKSLARSWLFRQAGLSPLQIDHVIQGMGGTGLTSLVRGLDIPGVGHYPGVDDLLHAATGKALPPQKLREMGGLVYSQNRFESENRFQKDLQQRTDQVKENQLEAHPKPKLVAGKRTAQKGEEVQPLPQEEVRHWKQMETLAKELHKLHAERASLDSSDPAQAVRIATINRTIREKTSKFTAAPGGRP